MVADFLVFILGGLSYLVLSVSPSQKFPPPLSHEEERREFAKMRAGDMAARGRLIEHNLRLVAHIVRKYYASQTGQEDLISIGTIGLIKAVDTFNADKGRLATYASRCIENEILMYMRKNASHRGDLSIDEPLNTDWDGNELLLSDVLGSDNDVVNRNIEMEDEKNQLLKLVSALEEREKQMMTLRFGIFG